MRKTTKVLLALFGICIVGAFTPWSNAAYAVMGILLVVAFFSAVIGSMNASDQRFEAELEAAGMTEAEKINARQLRKIRHNTEATALGTWTR